MKNAITFRVGWCVNENNTDVEHTPQEKEEEKTKEEPYSQMKKAILKLKSRTFFRQFQDFFLLQKLSLFYDDFGSYVQL